MSSDSISSLAGRHAIITGGGRGIGAAIATKLDHLGAKITLMGRTEAALEQKCEELANARALRVDVTDENSVKQAFSNAGEAFGPVNILVNNAGAADSAPLERTSQEIWSKMLDVNLTGLFYCSKAAIPSMKQAGWGRIINIVSTAGLKGYAYVSAYCAAKHGAIGLTRSLALEMVRTDITVNAICPGYTNTELLENSINNIMEKTGMNREKAEQQLKSSNPQNRFIEPEEVAATVAWLCLPGSESITGQSIAIAGGEIM